MVSVVAAFYTAIETWIKGYLHIHVSMQLLFGSIRNRLPRLCLA